MTATMPFDDLSIAWDDRVLEPRPWTALQSRWAAEVAESAGPGPLLEVCCGAGHIGLLAAHLSARPLVAVDVDPAACELTRLNAAAAGVDADVRCGTVSQVLSADETFPVVVLDPPWVPSADVARFPDDPRLAIDGGPDGLDVPRALVTACAPHLADGGALLLQLGDRDQARRLLPTLEDDAWRAVGLRDGDRGVVLRLHRHAG